jgi:hypothetical protein
VAADVRRRASALGGHRGDHLRDRQPQPHPHAGVARQFPRPTTPACGSDCTKCCWANYGRRAAGHVHGGVIDGSHVRALKGGPKTGPSPVDRRKPGSKHHVITDAGGIPLAVSLTGGNRHDVSSPDAASTTAPASAPDAGSSSRPSPAALVLPPAHPLGDPRRHPRSLPHQARFSARSISGIQGQGRGLPCAQSGDVEKREDEDQFVEEPQASHPAAGRYRHEPPRAAETRRNTHSASLSDRGREQPQFWPLLHCPERSSRRRAEERGREIHGLSRACRVVHPDHAGPEVDAERTRGDGGLGAFVLV